MDFETLKLMYSWGWIDAAYLTQAVAVGWITETQKAEILAK